MDKMFRTKNLSEMTISSVSKLEMPLTK